MKSCSKCKETKSPDSFRPRTGRANQLSSWCKSCKRDYDKFAYENDVGQGINRKAILVERSRLNAEENRKFLYQYYATHQCVDCGETDPIVLEFDHLRDKKNNVSRLIKWSRQILEDEIDKCEVVCANCHRRRTAKRAGWYKDIAE